ncbi:MAG TPA: stage V sporulation protein AD [Acetivibrio sp.]|uniref:stage V sporulation protein AD n=1 Tax=Acetivibrio sp. TaxID=1872092 RepID=UPI002BA80C24|nr:stage V sporulation protein AD [Acetivibrio sp.]HOM01641.1 stage V sporulation protein AD [Acetivibrio sp.]
MASKRLGKQTVKLQNPPSITSTASIVGPKEGKGPLRLFFDNIIEDEMWGEKSWEKAESKLIRETFSKILQKAGKTSQEINYVISGDLLNQCIAANFGLRESDVPFFGVYGACSTIAESMSIGAMLVDGGFADDVVCITSSHFCSAEKQFRYPLELGTQRPPAAQWTVTGSGGVLLSGKGPGPYITHITTGKIVDMGIKDANNMGAAMAPAAVDTIVTHFKDTGFTPESYDLILTGDLGAIGKEICIELVKEQGFNIANIYNDCGVMIFDREKQDTHAGGSGCGCAATVFAGFVYKKLMDGTLKNVLFIATGALLSPVSTQQGESIPSIAHAISITTSLNQ